MGSRTLRVGDRVSINRGQLSGLTGVISSFTSVNQRCVLNMDRLEGGIRVVIHSGDVQLTDSKAEVTPKIMRGQHMGVQQLPVIDVHCPRCGSRITLEPVRTLGFTSGTGHTRPLPWLQLATCADCQLSLRRSSDSYGWTVLKSFL